MRAAVTRGAHRGFATALAGNTILVFRRKRRVSETEETQPQPPPGQYVREEVVEPPPPPRRPLIWPWLLLLLLLVAGGLAAAYFLTRDDAGPESEVPQVVGLGEAQAVQRLGQNGYSADVRRRASQSEVGRVIDQEPDAGIQLDRGERVVVFVARGPSTVQVPKVVGLPVVKAFERLQGKGLKGRTQQVSSIGSEAPKGIVVRQSPASFEKAPRGSTVVLGVSSGPRRIAVPSLIGRTEADAGAELRRLGLRPNFVRIPSSEPGGTVIAQVPTAGGRVRRGAIVRLNVSKGPPPAATTSQAGQVTVPDVGGQDEATARDTLRAAGLIVRTSTRRAPDPAQDGVVIDQRPRAGQTVARGSRVTIYVGRFG